MRPPASLPPPAACSLYGVDFTSAPSRRKPIVIAQGRWGAGQVVVERFHRLTTLVAWEAWLQQPGPWVAGLDMPLGLPRALVHALGWPAQWRALMQHYIATPREQLRAQFVEFCAARPVGQKFAHRVCDGPAGASPAMKWVNPPVAWMLHAGMPGLLAAGVALPGLCEGDAQRLALEAYPGLLAREVLGRQSYKSDAPAKQTPERREARQRVLAALEAGQHRLGVPLVLTPEQHAQARDDGSGDTLDALLCLLQVAWAHTQPRWGWPDEVDALEGWILSA